MNDTKSTKLVFFGSDENSAKLLNELIKAGYNIALVVTKTNKKTGRIKKQNPVKKIVLKNNIPTLEKDNFDDHDSSTLKNINAKLGILLSFGAIIPENILNLFPLGILNIHPSLLPKHRGPSPVQTALLDGDGETGVSIMLLSKEMDTGPILIQQKVKIDIKDNFKTLSNKLFKLGNQLLLNNLEKYINKKIKPKVQDKSKSTYTKIIKKQDGLINWNDSAKNINNKIRAFYNWPSAYTYFNNKPQHLNKCRGKLLKIIKADINLNKNTSRKIGEVFLENNKSPHFKEGGGDKIAIQCGKGILNPKIVQLESREKMNIDSFINGYKNFIGTILK